MSPIRDATFVLYCVSDVVVFSGTDATGQEYPATSAAYEFEGTGDRGMDLHLYTGTMLGAPSLSVRVLGSSTSTITTVSATYQIVAERRDIVAAGEYIIPFISNKRTFVFDFVTESASGSFSSGEAWVTLPVGLDWTRGVEFH